MIRRKEDRRGSEIALSIAGALGVALAMGAGGVAIALAGLGVLTPDIDPATAPGWLWYYRADPRVQLWMAIGLGIVLGAGGLITFAGRRMASRDLTPKRAPRVTCTVDMSPGGVLQIQLAGPQPASAPTLSVRLQKEERTSRRSAHRNPHRDADRGRPG